MLLKRTSLIIGVTLCLAAPLVQAEPDPASLPSAKVQQLLIHHDAEKLSDGIATPSLNQQADELLESRGSNMLLNKLLDEPAVDGLVKPFTPSRTRTQLTSDDDVDELVLPLWPKRLKRQRSTHSPTQWSEQLVSDKSSSAAFAEALPEVSSAIKKQRSSRPARLTDKPLTSSSLTDDFIESQSLSSSSPLSASASESLGSKKRKHNTGQPLETRRRTHASELTPRELELQRSRERRWRLRKQGDRGVLEERYSEQELKDARKLRKPGASQNRSHLDEKALRERLLKDEAKERMRIRAAGVEGVLSGKYTPEEYIAAFQPRRGGRVFSVDPVATLMAKLEPKQTQIGKGEASSSQTDTKAPKRRLEVSQAAQSRPSSSTLEATLALKPQSSAKVTASDIPHDAVTPTATRPQRHRLDRPTQLDRETAPMQSEDVAPTTNRLGFPTVALMRPKPKPAKPLDAQTLETTVTTAAQAAENGVTKKPRTDEAAV